MGNVAFDRFALQKRESQVRNEVSFFIADMIPFFVPEFLLLDSKSVKNIGT